MKIKLTIFELENLPSILIYMEPHHKKKSIELLNKIVNEGKNIDTEKRDIFIKKIIKYILTFFIRYEKNFHS